MKPFEYKGWYVETTMTHLTSELRRYNMHATFDRIVITKVRNDYSDYRLAHLKFLHKENPVTDTISVEGYDYDVCVLRMKKSIDEIGKMEKISFPKEDKK